MSAQEFRRKLTAIVAADAVGYSRLMEMDEAGTLSRLNAIRHRLIEPRVRHHRGRIVKTAGDGFLIEFQSAAAAVAFGLDLQAELAAAEAPFPEETRIRLRIGINLGDVIHDKGDVFGDGVNVAARLEQMAEPDGLCVSRTVFEQVRGRLPFVHEELGPQSMKNIERPVDAYRLRPGPGYTAGAVAPNKRGYHVVLGATLLAVAAAAGAATLLWNADRPAATRVQSAAPPPDQERQRPRLSIAVLPFTNLSGDPRQEYFADGLTEDLITDLSRITGSFVIARNSAFTYKGKSVDVRRVGRELGVRYVLEGSVRRDGGRVRVNSQLIEAETGAHVWAERFDRDQKDSFAVQSEITGRIARALNLELIEAESRRQLDAGAQSLEAYDLALRGWVILLNKPQTRETNVEAEGFVRQALALEPNSALAWTAMCYIHTRAANFGWSPSAEESTAAAVAAGERAVQLDPRSSDASYMLGYALRTSGQVERSMAAMEKAIALNPNNPLPYHGLAYGKILLGRSDEAVPHLEQAFNLSPREPLAAVWHWTAAHALLLTGHDESAIERAKRAIAVNPRFPRSYLILAAAAAHLGREAEARDAVAEYLKHSASLRTVADVADWARTLSANAVYRSQSERMFAGLRKAGFPD